MPQNKFQKKWQNFLKIGLQMHGKIGKPLLLKQAAHLSLRFAEHSLITHKPSSLQNVIIMNMKSEEDILSGISELMIIGVSELAEFHMDKFLVDIRKGKKVAEISELYKKHSVCQLNSKGLFQGEDTLFAECIRRSIEDGQSKNLIQILKEEEDDSRMMDVMKLCLGFGWNNEAKCLLKEMELLGIDSARYGILFRTALGYENKVKVICGKPPKGWAKLNTDGRFRKPSGSESEESEETEEIDSNSWVGGI